tara:strand:+ start:10293 stop:10628 length:336 start_codon:yes stop_codon:yes gene_type:complete
MSKAWQPYAHHILDCITKIRRIMARGDITEDDILYDAAVRNLQTMSEATQRLPKELQSAHPGIPWAEISGFRNILVHNYLGDIDPVAVKSVIEEHLHPLELAMHKMLEDSA